MMRNGAHNKAHLSKHLRLCILLRTYDEQELDIVEERDGELFGYELKWSEKKVQATERVAQNIQ